jgi:hypothetical protein
MHTTISAPARRRLALAGASLVIAATVAACGSDGDSGGSGSGETSAAAADPTEFCAAVVEVEAAFGMGPQIDETTPPEEAQAALEEFSAQVEPLLTRAEETAPDEVADDVATAADLARQALTGDQAVLESPEFQEADAGIDEFVVGECGFESIDAVGTDYEYEGIPDSLPAGTATVTFSNEGEELHEIGLIRINDDVDLSLEELLQLPEEQAMTMAQFVGAAFAAPGEADTTYLDLEPGRYGAVCFIPQGTTHEHEGNGPPHLALGMLAEFTVE